LQTTWGFLLPQTGAFAPTVVVLAARLAANATWTKGSFLHLGMPKLGSHLLSGAVNYRTNLLFAIRNAAAGTRVAAFLSAIVLPKTDR
jgi:hypothetical protein